MRRVLACVVALLALGTGTACSGPPQIVCPAIGWFNTVEVALDGPVHNVDTVQLCIRGICSITDPDRTPEPQNDSPAPTATGVPPTGVQTGDRSWTFSLQMTTPQRATVRALTSAHAVLAERNVKLQWTRVGGTVQCGGPSEAAPVVLSIPA